MSKGLAESKDEQATKWNQKQFLKYEYLKKLPSQKYTLNHIVM